MTPILDFFKKEKDTCDYCDGEGDINCPDCEGDGITREGTRCARCDHEGMVICEECDGYGECYEPEDDTRTNDYHRK